MTPLGAVSSALAAPQLNIRHAAAVPIVPVRVPVATVSPSTFLSAQLPPARAGAVHRHTIATAEELQKSSELNDASGSFPTGGFSVRDASATATATACPSSTALLKKHETRETPREGAGAGSPPPNMLLLPVAMCKTISLAPQATLSDGALALRRRLPAAVADHSALPSGVLRLEVAVPRTATTALRWLSGQQQRQHPQQQQQQPRGAGPRGGPAAGGPFLYFSGRRSSAPDTPGAAAAEAATRGWSSLAGAGAAWRWWGPGGGGFDSRVVSALQRFLSPDQPHVRILGGVRFDPRSDPDPEWSAFGSYCFVLPLLELTEAEDCCLLAVTLAWDPVAAAAAAAEEAAAGRGTAAGGTGFWGCGDLASAAARAETALRQMQPPAPTSAYGLRVTRSTLQHAPSQGEWDSHMAALLRGLQEGHDTEAPAAAALASLLDTGLARQEYLTHGQQGLDDLLAAMTLSASTAGKGVRPAADAADGGDSFDELRDLIDGKVSTRLSDLAVPPPAHQGSGGAAAGQGAAAAAGEEEEEGELSKVVMARRTTMLIEGPLDPLHALLSLQERDPRAYQLYFAPGTGFGAVEDGGGAATSAPGTSPGPAFLACTPERLYARTGRFVASEAVAGTRPRGRGGDVEQDFWLSLDLLRSAKDHVEFCTVRDWIAGQLAGPCEDVRVEIRKSVLKQGSVQHLFGRVAAALRRGRNDAHLLEALHPTPAVCGRPREAALGYLDELESFDRGWYAGPFGWISGAGAEFVVAIRSGLVCPTGPETTATTTAAEPPAAASSGAAGGPKPAPPQLQPQPQPQSRPQPPSSLVHMYAGVGVVRGSDPAAEWQELDLKIRPLSSALMPAPLPASAPNVNVAWAGLLVEELCRLGVNMFCVAPGSRSSPLTHAIACHPRARLNVCVDERSLGFWALGYGRAAGRPAAVVTSSGTAVANLLPAVVEAGLSGVPLLLLTADRPAELRDTAANQTIDQTKIFGGFVRWFLDLPPPSPTVPGRTVLTAASTAFRAAVASCPPGPVHLNLQFQEPLAPVAAPWASGTFMTGLATWQNSQLPYTSHISAAALPAPPLPRPPSTLDPADAAATSYGAVPDVAALQALLRGARRGLLVAGELTDPRDIVAARQIGAALGWPVVADVLSGLRVGAAPAPPAGTPPKPATPYDNSVLLVHHMDHLLLGDRSWWSQLRPDLILQLGPHLTSKRLGQFMDWAALGDGAAAGVPWVYVAAHTLRHDPSHLLTHRAVMSLPEFRDAVVGPVAVTEAAAGARYDGVGDPWAHVSAYGLLLQQLDEAVSREVDVALSSLESISEPFIARALARCLPAGHGLFIGNSMPIRDMDMYACPPAATRNACGGANGGGGAAASAGPSRAVLGVAVAANRGASGIDGVLSTAAGFAEGLSRPATLLVGDLSFLHDINGLNLLRTGELRPPLTVVLVNNSGGGIFSFLPIASAVPEEEFTPLWATPQNVDLEAMCRAQGIPHQKVTSSEALLPALQAAWGLNRHSVVEVITDRLTNVDLHRRIQAAALRAAQHCYRLAMRVDAALGPLRLGATYHSASAPASALKQASLPVTNSTTNSSISITSSSSSGCPFVAGELQWRRYSLPLARPLTTTCSDPEGARGGMLLRLRLHWSGSGTAVAGEGVGEVAPLPGLHRETLQEAEVQVAALSSLLEGVPVPPSLALLGGRMRAWLAGSVGLDPDRLLPSVRFGLECALLSSLAAALRVSLTDLLAPPPPPPQQSDPVTAEMRRGAVLVNGLLSPPVSGDDEADAAAAAAAAVQLVVEGFTGLKVKVARRSDPEADARVLAAVRAAVGPHIALRADANRGWSGLAEALAFGHAVAAAGVGLQYVEEPTADPRDMAAFFNETGVPVAADESLDEGLLMTPEAPASGRGSGGAGAVGGFGSETGLGGAATAVAGSYNAAGLPTDRAAGLAAVVVKPAVVGGIEAAMATARWAQLRGAHPVISSSFESSVGLAHLLQLAAAVDGGGGAGGAGSGIGSVHHGLGTLQWLAADVAAEPLAMAPHLLPPGPPSAATVAATGASTAAGPEFLPLQALGGSVEQADRLLQACASGGGLRREALVAGPQPEGGASDDAERKSSDAGAPTSDTVGPWVGAHARGGVVELPIDVEVSITASSSSSASPRPTSEIPMAVRVRGLEVLPPNDGSGAVRRDGQQRGRRQPSPRPFLFLHGFLGSSSDWLPLMRALAAAGHRCVALDLPGHGGTVPPLRHGDMTAAAASVTAADAYGATGSAVHSIPGAADCVCAAARQLGLEGALLVGYSLGARVALQAAVDAGGAASDRPSGNGNDNGNGNGHMSATASGASLDGSSASGGLWSGVVLVSGTPGIKDQAQAAARAANDDRLAGSLVQTGVEDFVRRWYEQPLWASLRGHPAFGRMLARRLAAAAGVPSAAKGGGAGSSHDAAAAQLAAALRGMSTGRMEPLWDRLDPWVGPPVVLVAGDLDAKFVDINTYTLARLVRRRTAAAAAAATAGPRDGTNPSLAGQDPVPPQFTPLPPPALQWQQQPQGDSTMSLSEQLQQLGHALVRISGVGHAVHIEAPTRLLELLQDAAEALERLGA